MPLARCERLAVAAEVLELSSGSSGAQLRGRGSRGRREIWRGAAGHRGPGVCLLGGNAAEGDRGMGESARVTRKGLNQHSQEAKVVNAQGWYESALAAGGGGAAGVQSLQLP